MRRPALIEVSLATVKDDVSGYVKQSARDEVLIPRHGKLVATLIGFAAGNPFPAIIGPAVIVRHCPLGKHKRAGPTEGPSRRPAPVGRRDARPYAAPVR
jgi:hypothetical protein